MGCFPPVVPLALQPETSSQADAVDEAVVAVVAATHAELKAEANSVRDQFKNLLKGKSIDAVNTAKVDAQCESAKDVQSNEDEAKVEHVHAEAKEVATANLALVSTAQVLGTPEQHTYGDQPMDLNADGVQIALQLEIWATRRLHVDFQSS